MIRGAEEPVEAVHAQEDTTAAGRLDHRGEFRQNLKHRVDGGVVVSWIGFEERQRGAEGDRLRDELAWPDTGFVGALRDLPDRTTGALAVGEQGNRGAVELG